MSDSSVRALRRAVFPETGMLVARYGGGEFAVILSDTPEDAAVAVASKFVLVLWTWPSPTGALHRPVFDGEPRRRNAVSGSPWRAEQLVNMADHALYQAKHAGRNRVIAFTGASYGHQTDWVANPID